MRRVSLASSLVGLVGLVRFLGACHATPANAVVDDAYFVRQPDGTIAADVDVTAASSNGRDIGPHCVSVHYFNPGTDLGFVYPAAAYGGERELVFQCFQGGLEDGDTRRVHLVTTHTDIPVGTTVRAQVLVSGRFDTKDETSP